MNEIRTLSLPEILLTLNGGGTVEEIQTQIKAVSSAVLETGNTGSITIKLAFARNGGDGSNQLKVKDSVSVTMPKTPKAESLFFVSDDGLTRQDPAQLAMFDREGVR